MQGIVSLHSGQDQLQVLYVRMYVFPSRKVGFNRMHVTIINNYILPSFLVQGIVSSHSGQDQLQVLHVHMYVCMYVFPSRIVGFNRNLQLKPFWIPTAFTLTK